MSTVILTPTHIACDHNVVASSDPQVSEMDLSHKKIFISPMGQYLIAVDGQYIPELVDSLKSWDAFSLALTLGMTFNSIGGLINNYYFIKNKEVNTQLNLVFHSIGSALIVTRHERYKLERLDEGWSIQKLGDYGCLGSGGYIALGLLLGGMKLNDIWKPLSDLDQLSSKEHSIFPLSILKQNRKANKALRDSRNDLK